MVQRQKVPVPHLLVPQIYLLEIYVSLNSLLVADSHHLPLSASAIERYITQARNKHSKALASTKKRTTLEDHMVVMLASEPQSSLLLFICMFQSLGNHLLHAYGLRL